MKCMKQRYKSKEEVEESNEVQALLRFSSNDNIIKLIEVLYDDSTGHAAMVFELMDINLYEAIKGKKVLLPEKKVKGWIYQVLKALDCIHRKGLFHRDIKPENILLKGDIVKLADFGSCKGIYAKHPFTEYVSTRWYRSPECLITDGYYNFKMDIWGLGCVFFETLTLFPLFPGDDELDQLAKIHQVLGTPGEAVMNDLKRHSTNDAIDEIPFKKGYGIRRFLTHVPDECIDLISQMLEYNPDERLSANQALRHPYFRDLFELDCRVSADNNNCPIRSLNFNESTHFGKIGDSMLNLSSKPILKGEAKTKAKNKLKDEKEQMGSIVLPVIETQKNISNNNENKNKGNEEILLVTFGSGLPLIKHSNEFQYLLKNGRNNMMSNLNDFKKTLKPKVLNNSIELNAKIISTHYSKKYQASPGHNIILLPKQSKYNRNSNNSIMQNNNTYKYKYKYISPYSQKNMANKILI